MTIECQINAGLLDLFQLTRLLPVNVYDCRVANGSSCALANKANSQTRQVDKRHFYTSSKKESQERRDYLII